MLFVARPLQVVQNYSEAVLGALASLLRRLVRFEVVCCYATGVGSWCAPLVLDLVVARSFV